LPNDDLLVLPNQSIDQRVVFNLVTNIVLGVLSKVVVDYHACGERRVQPIRLFLKLHDFDIESEAIDIVILFFAQEVLQLVKFFLIVEHFDQYGFNCVQFFGRWQFFRVLGGQEIGSFPGFYCRHICECLLWLRASCSHPRVNDLVSVEICPGIKLLCLELFISLPGIQLTQPNLLGIKNTLKLALSCRKLIVLIIDSVEALLLAQLGHLVCTREITRPEFIL